MIPLFLQAMLEHPSQIIRFGESVIPTVMVYTGKFLITDISSCFLQCFISVTGELYIDYAIGAAMINTESRLALKVCQTLQFAPPQIGWQRQTGSGNASRYRTCPYLPLIGRLRKCVSYRPYLPLYNYPIIPWRRPSIVWPEHSTDRNAFLLFRRSIPYIQTKSSRPGIEAL